jgi:hypothetical protein
LFWAPLGTAVPTNTVAGSVFTDAWAAEWVPLGATEEGHSFSFSTETETVDVAEFLDPIKYVETGREGSVSFSLVSITSANLKRALNGGTIATTGSTATTLTKYTPAALGASVRCMLGWESQDSTERYVWYQCFNTSGIEISRRKGADKATMPVEFALEVPSTGVPFEHWAAGVARTGA